MTRRKADVTDVLVERCGTRDELEMFLDLQVDGRRLDQICGPTLDLRIAAYRVVDRAESEGWLELLVEAIVRRWDDGPTAARLGPAASPVAIPVDPSRYDMHEHLEEFGLACDEARHGLVGAAVPAGSDTIFLRHLHARMSWACRAECLDGYAVDVYNSPRTLLGKLGHLDRRLERQSLLVPIRVTGTDEAAELVTEVWEGLVARSSEPRHDFVVVFAVDASAVPRLPAGIRVLPAAPAVERRHIVAFVNAVLRDVPDWTTARSRRLVQTLHDQAMQAEEPVRLHRLYAALDEMLDRIRDDWTSFVMDQDAS